jgi:hypothetical protein
MTPHQAAMSSIFCFLITLLQQIVKLKTFSLAAVTDELIFPCSPQTVLALKGTVGLCSTQSTTDLGS